jgi:phage gp37-like protein
MAQMHELEEIEQTVMATLEPLKSQGVREIEAYAGQVDEEDIEALAKLIRRFPCIYVVADGLELTHKSRNDDEIIGVVLIVGCRNLRGTEAARLGDANTVGVYDILEMAENLLHRKKIHAAGTMRLRQAAPLYLAPKQGLCFYGARYEFTTIKT